VILARGEGLRRFFVLGRERGEIESFHAPWPGAGSRIRGVDSEKATAKGSVNSESARGRGHLNLTAGKDEGRS